MELKKLDKGVLMLWYIRAAIASPALVGVVASTAVILNATGASNDVMLAVLWGAGMPVVLILGFTFKFYILSHSISISIVSSIAFNKPSSFMHSSG